MEFDLHSQVFGVQALAPVSITDNTARVSAIIDTDGYLGLEFITNIGTLADADATFAVTIEDGDASNLSDAAAVATEFLLGTTADAGFTFSDDDEIRRLGYVGKKRYVRYTITPSNNTGAAIFGLTAVLYTPLNGPASENT